MFGISKTKSTRPADDVAAGKPRSKGKATAAGEDDLLISVGVKMSAAQHEKLLRLGADAWVRDRIDKAKEPPPR